MIVRIWRGTAENERAEDYRRHVTEAVFPALARLAGHRGAYLLRRAIGARAEFLAVTLWETRAAIESFAGADIDTAIVEPEARAVLAEFDDFARHYELAYSTCPPPQA
jgi:heme-degrading monooxygenase HmoA